MLQLIPAVLLEDGAVVAFNKPAGLPVTPDPRHTEAGSLLAWAQQKMSPDLVNAHRPDPDTSGVLLCARTKPTLGELSRQFERNEVSERYLVMVRPVPLWREYQTDLRIALDPVIEGKMKAGGHGKEAETRFHVLEKWPACALVEAFPRTHRKHQVRVHIATLGCPAVGDLFYGGCRSLLLSELKRRYKKHKDEPEHPLIGRVALHLESLTFVHPESGQPLTVRAPLPDDFNVAMKYLSRFDVTRSWGKSV